MHEKSRDHRLLLGATALLPGPRRVSLSADPGKADAALTAMTASLLPA